MPRFKAELLAVPDHLQDIGSCDSSAKALMGRAVVPWHHPGSSRAPVHLHSLTSNLKPTPAHSSQWTSSHRYLWGTEKENVTTEARAGRSENEWPREINQTLWRIPVRRLDSGY